MADSSTDTVADAPPPENPSERRAGPPESAAESGKTISTTLIDQAETNAREAFAALRAAAASKDLSEVLQVQADYLREQSSRSMAHARQISDLIVQIGKDAVAPLKR